ncbi:MAG TPA: hypothetical protein VG498_20680, partial [Terriglobales bacterium]|nr:hypothetical protein [Terriglobales bacterium]
TGMAVLTESRNLGFLLSSILAFGGLWVMWRRHNPATFLYASLLFAAPLVYYLTFPHPRYRAPIEPEMLILMVGLFLAAEPRKRKAAERLTLRQAERAA